MFKRFALVVVLATVALGIVFIGLNILDIEEGFRLQWPVAILNTVLISAVAVVVAYFAAACFTASGLPEILGLGCAVLAFGVGSLLRGWMAGIGLSVPITVYDTAALIAAVAHLIGAALGMAGRSLAKLVLRQKRKVALFCYLGTLSSIALVALLAFRGVIPSFIMPGESNILLRDVVRCLAAIFALAASFIYLRIYFRSHTDFYYWYSLGLMLFAFGIVFISQGAVASRIAWLGRAAQYVGGIYFLISALDAYRLISVAKAKAISNR